MNLKRVLWLMLMAVSILFIIQAPTEAARLVKVTGEHAGDWLGTAADSFSTFVKSLV